MSIASPPRFVLGIAFGLLAGGCGSTGDADPNGNDPFANAEVVRCDMPADHACREYNRGRQGDATAFVDLPAARSSCEDGWPGGDPAPGAFSAASCSPDDALGRCVTQTRTIPTLLTLDYFYTGFADGSATADGLRGICAAIEKNAPQGSEVTSVFEAPPF